MIEVQPEADGISPHRRILALEEVPACAPRDGRIMQLVNDDEASLEELAAAIETNPGLTANVVGMANTAFFSPPHEVFSVHDAIVSVLGQRTVRSLVGSLLVSGSVDTRKCTSFDAVQYWTRNLAVARCAQLLAQRLVPGVAPDAAYLCGLLHELGLLALVHLYGPGMNAVLDLHALPSNTRSIVDLEEDLLEFTHPEAGRLMALRWNLPEAVAVTAAEWRHAGYRGPCWEHAGTVGLAVAYVRTLDGGKDSLDLHAGAVQLGVQEPDLLDALGAFNDQYADVVTVARQLASAG